MTTNDIAGRVIEAKGLDATTGADLRARTRLRERRSRVAALAYSSGSYFT
jgi:hypothetical protein